MPSDRIIGRTYEQAIIKRCLENEEAQLIAYMVADVWVKPF